MFEKWWVWAIAFIIFVNVLLTLRSFGSGDDDMEGIAPPRSVDSVLETGFHAWVEHREQVRDSHLLEDVRVLVHPNRSEWPGVVVEEMVAEFKETVVRVDIVLDGVSVPSRYPHVVRRRSEHERERQRGAEAVEFIRNVIFAGDGDLFLKSVEADGSGRFTADVYVYVGGERTRLNKMIEDTGHGVRASVLDWGSRRVREVSNGRRD